MNYRRDHLFSNNDLEVLEQFCYKLLKKEQDLKKKDMNEEFNAGSFSTQGTTQ